MYSLSFLEAWRSYDSYCSFKIHNVAISLFIIIIHKIYNEIIIFIWI